MATRSSTEEARGPAFRSGRDGIRHLSRTYAQAFIGLVRAAQQLERRLDRDLRNRHGIGLRGYEVLLHLAAFSPDGELPLTQLTQQAPLSQSQVSRLVSELEATGLVRRHTDEHDSRAVLVAITERGLQALRSAQQTHHQGLDEGLFSRLSRAEVAELARITTKLLA